MDSGKLHTPKAEVTGESSHNSPGHYISSLAFHTSAMIWQFLYTVCEEI